ncbi:MAG: AHH domain-containing protein, partial [Deltaproteobacteria bacterium]|nr:AHH domain-containing protein [Deltaproteobacteria bacterium]
KNLIKELIEKEHISDVNTELEEELRELLIKARIPKYKIGYSEPGKVLNFTGASKPYPNRAHHILPCQVFYHSDWTVERLTTVKRCGYNINNEGNILYMPNQSIQNKYGEYDKCFFHGFPNHCKNHPRYNDKVCTIATKLMDKADEAKCGDEKKLEELFNMLIDIEKEFYEYLIKRKPGLPMLE